MRKEPGANSSRRVVATPRTFREPLAPGYFFDIAADADSGNLRLDRRASAHRRVNERYRTASRGFDHFFHAVGSASILMNTPPITGRA